MTTNNISNSSKRSEYIRDTCPSNICSIVQRKQVYGVGINDADYVTQPIINGVQFRCPAYSAWVSMLSRSYGELFTKKFKTYSEVTVCTEWLRFSKFRAWFIENHVDGYALDKDLFSSGNKIYSPNTCIYIPSWINTFITDRNSVKGDYPVGVSIEKRSNKLMARCRHPKGKDSEFLGYFDSEYSAHDAWVTRKIEIANSLKSEMDEIDPRIHPKIVQLIISK